MKKSILAVALILGATTTFAQKAGSDTPMSLEGVINFNGSSLMWQSPTIRYRYFVTDNIAARVEIGLGDGLGTPMSEHYDFNKYNNADSSGVNRVGTADLKNSAWNAQIGGEYHLDGTDRISPYFMLGINFGGGSSSMSTVDSDGTSYMEDISVETAGKMSMFGVGAGAGLDVYIIENVYIGFELGLNFSSYSYKDMTSVTTDNTGATQVTTSTFADDSKMSSLTTGAGSAAIRLGWRF